MTSRAVRALLSVACGVSVSALGSGCSSGAPASTSNELVGHASAPIIGGTPSTSEQDAVVLLAVRPGGELRGTCTATMVAPNLVLTARHCVADTDPGALCSESGRAINEGAVRADYDAADLYVYTGVDGLKDIGSPDQAAARGKQIVHENVTTICNADLAFILLDRSVQGRIAPLRLKGGARAGEKLTAVGWGLTEAGDLPTKRLQRTDVPVLGIGPVTLDAQNDVGLGASEFIVGEVFCSGDSGGPSFSSKGALVGVVSRGGGGGKDEANDASNCIGGNVFNFYTHLGDKPALVAEAFALAGVEPRSEGEAPGVAVGETCKANLDCSSDACVNGTCERRCDDGTTCASTEICTTFETKKVCAPAPEAEPPQPAPAGDPAPPPADAPVTTTTTTSTGCSASTSRSTRSSGGRFGFGLGLALVAMRRRRSNACGGS